MPEPAQRGTISCCVCGSSDARPWRTAGDNLLGGAAVWRAVRCARCETVRLDPRPPADQMAAFYPPDLYARSEPNAGETDEIGCRLDQYNDGLAARALLPGDGGAAGKNVLDVGCGDGRFLAALRARGATSVTGLETDPVAANLARRRTGGPVLEAPLEDADLPDASFDLVSLLHVLEHVPDPRATLLAARRVLRPSSGALFLALPNAASLEAAVFGRAWYHLDLPRHLWGWGPRTLTRLLEETGFEVQAIRFFPFLFAPQSVRNVLRGVLWTSRPGRAAHAKEHGRRAAGSPTSALLTRFVAGWLRASERLGNVWPGEIMEVVARPPGGKEKR